MKSNFEAFIEKLELYITARHESRLAGDPDAEADRELVIRLEDLFERAVKEAATEYNEE